MFQQFQNLQQNQNNPQEVLNNMVKGYTPEQLKNFSNYVKGFGITDEQLKNYGISTK